MHAAGQCATTYPSQNTRTHTHLRSRARCRCSRLARGGRRASPRCSLLGRWSRGFLRRRRGRLSRRCCWGLVASKQPAEKATATGRGGGGGGGFGGRRCLGLGCLGSLDFRIVNLGSWRRCRGRADWWRQGLILVLLRTADGGRHAAQTLEEIGLEARGRNHHGALLVGPATVSNR